MNRRDALKALAALGIATPLVAQDQPAAAKKLGLVIHSYWIRGVRPLEPDFPAIATPLAFVTHAAKIGAAGVQTKIGVLPPIELARLRETIEKHGLYLEGIINLPKDEADAARFSAEVEAAKAAGADVLRTVCTGGRRYEQFQTSGQFREFAEQSWRSLRLSEPIVARQKVRLAIENHKDWRIDEMVAWLRRMSSEYLGVCLDTGNSIALLEEPHSVVDAYAPWTFTTHLKDMGVADYEAGFLLSEVPLGDGFLDLPRIVATLKKARPEVRFNLEMITRDPLRVPCLTPKYWTTLGEVRGEELASALERVRRHKFPGALPVVAGLSHIDQLRAEEANIARCMDYAAKKLAGMPGTQ